MFRPIHDISAPKPAGGSENSHLSSQSTILDVHPWPRYWGRLIDTNLFSHLTRLLQLNN
jgi:hypothetical protein